MLTSNMEDSVILNSAPSDIGKRIDAYVAENSELTRSAAAKLVESGDITVNGKEIAKNYKLRAGDEVEIELPEPEPDRAEPEDIPLDVVYEDDDIIVVNKPCGMVVHPAAGNPRGTLVNALLYRCKGSLSGIGGVVRPGIVHRIDKDTSGLLVAAKNDEAHNSLAEQLKVHAVSRVYYAIIIGSFAEDSGTVDAPIGRHPTDRKKMAVLKEGQGTARNAVTHYTVIARYKEFSLVRCELETGRTHQIRVHMAYKGHPLVGDVIYGGGRTQFEAANKHLINGQCLHAKELSLTHPKTGKLMHFECELPEDMKKLIEKLEKTIL